MTENKRTCFKCGRSPFADNIKLFRFPNPGVRNLVRCELWAKYMFPDKTLTVDEQRKLFSEHRMLCQEHFKNEDFLDTTHKYLVRNAVPFETEYIVQPPSMPLINRESDALQKMPLMEVTNTQCVAPTMKKIEEQNISSSVIDAANTGTSFQPVTHTNQEKIFAKCSKYMRKVCELQQRLKKIKKLKNKGLLNELSDAECISKLSKNVTPTFALLLASQIRNHKRKRTGRRWTKEEKISALRLYKRSPTCYRLLRRLFHLPSQSTLKSLLNKVPFNVGINKTVFEVIKKYIDVQKPSDNNFILMFDEMSLKKHLNYNIKEDVIEGYQDHGAQGRSHDVAGYALVFMIAGLRKRVKQPIAHYFSSGFSTADRLTVLIKEVLHQCSQAGINIAAIVCDMDGVNRRALSILGATIQNPSITVDGKEYVTLFDPPHLLKCFRNLFLKYDIECSTDISSENNMTGRGIAKWSHIRKFFEEDNKNPNFVYAPALTKHHLDLNTKQKMKVKLAAQVLSHSVAAGIYSKIHEGVLPAEAVVTANVVSNMDKLFDTLNSDQPDLRRGKPHATNLTAKSLHLELFKKMRIFFETMKFINCKRKPPSQEGWVHTLNAIERLWKNLTTEHKITSLATRRLQQDPLENLFGCIRGNCGSNTNPTTGQFVAGLKTAILNNLPQLGTGNCETDNHVVINNLKTLLSVSKPTHTSTDQTEFNYVDLPPIDEILEDVADVQACAYVCGFLVKKLGADCPTCKNIFLSSGVEAQHSFVEWREYTDTTKSLKYVTKSFVDCVECCATIINKYLTENGYKNNVKQNIVNNLNITVNFDFMSLCPQHKAENIKQIINNVFYVCTKRFCTIENRKFAEQASASALKRKVDILLHR